MRTGGLRIARIVIIVAFSFIIIGAVLLARAPLQTPEIYGVTFAPHVADIFGLDPRVVYAALLDDLKIRHIRVGAYWNRIERMRGEFNFTDLDWQVAEAEKRGAELIIVVGRKVPRWPECHIPTWVSSLSESEQDGALLNYVTRVVERYKSSPSVRLWQVENEPFLPFGECPKFSTASIDQEIALVRSLDVRPVLVTDSGELSIWVRAAKRGDVFGTTLYRRVQNKYFGAIEYPLSPTFFRLKRALTELFVGKKSMMVIELQGEPWLSKPVEAASIEEQYTSMDPAYFRYVLDYASQTGFDTFYLWGVEWWYWLKVHDHPEIWDIMKTKIQSVS